MRFCMKVFHPFPTQPFCITLPLEAFTRQSVHSTLLGVRVVQRTPSVLPQIHRAQNVAMDTEQISSIKIRSKSLCRWYINTIVHSYFFIYPSSSFSQKRIIFPYQFCKGNLKFKIKIGPWIFPIIPVQSSLQPDHLFPYGPF
jgi:hypothetical protein